MADRMGRDVRVVYPANELAHSSLAKVFNAATGRVVGVEMDGRTKLYRVLLDKPVEVEGVGLVEDDLWAGRYLVNRR